MTRRNVAKVESSDAVVASLLETDYGHVRVLTLNRPSTLNAFDGELLDAVALALNRSQLDDGVRVLVLTGEGRGFCAGLDVSMFKDPTGAPSQTDKLDEIMWWGRHTMGLYEFDKPLIAAVNGVAAGMGMSLALACDLRVGGPDTRFRTVFLERNLSPDSGMSYFLPRIVGYSRALDLITTSRDVGGEEAFRLGLLDRLSADGDVLGLSVELATSMASLPPLALRVSKRVLRQNQDRDIRTALGAEVQGHALCRLAPNDGVEAMDSFIERRKPHFTGT